MTYFDFTLGKIIDVERILSPFKTSEEFEEHWKLFEESRKPLNQE